MDTLTYINQKRFLWTGLDYGLLPRIHTDEFENIGGAQLASAMKCVSADHLMCVNDSDIMKMVESNVKAVLLQVLHFFLENINMLHTKIKRFWA